MTADIPHTMKRLLRPAIVAQAGFIRPHQYLVREGDPPSHLHLLLEGWAGRYRLLPDGRRQIVNLYIPGDLCDPAWLMTTDHRTHPVVALTPLRTLRAARRDIEAEAADNAPFVATLWQETQVSAAIKGEWIVNLGRKNALERLAHFFCEIFHRLEQAGRAGSGECEMPLTQVELADIAGLTPVHVNRVLQDMRGAGLVELHGRRLRIPDMERLARLAFFHPGYLKPALRARTHDFICLAA
jgi:CRP-like cAMP-binding protein